MKDPRDQEVQYIGQTINPKQRFARHISPYYYNDGTHKANWVKQLISLNLLPIMEILEVVNEDVWQETEIDAGGKGGPKRAVSKSTKEKLSHSISRHWAHISTPEYHKR